MNKMVVLNHKMYLDFLNVKDYIMEIKDYVRTDIDVVICPSSIFIPFFRGKYNFKLGTQNISGVFCTGEVSANQLKSMDVSYAIIGHAERKKILNESNKLINLKIKDCLNNGIIPIICVGETFEERTRKKTQDVIVRQIRDYLQGVDLDSNVIFCYEPFWAINSSEILSNDEIKEVIDMIKRIIYRAHNVEVRVLYGGGIDEKNIKRLVKIPSIDGFMVGNVSVEPRKVLKIINSLD